MKKLPKIPAVLNSTYFELEDVAGNIQINDYIKLKDFETLSKKQILSKLKEFDNDYNEDALNELANSSNLDDDEEEQSYIKDNAATEYLLIKKLQRIVKKFK